MSRSDFLTALVFFIVVVVVVIVIVRYVSSHGMYFVCVCVCVCVCAHTEHYPEHTHIYITCTQESTVQTTT